MDKYSEELKILLKKSENEALKFKQDCINTLSFLLAVLNSKSTLQNVLNSFDITYKKVKNDVLQNSSSGYPSFDINFKKIIEASFACNKENGINELNEIILFTSILDIKNDLMTLIIKKYTRNFNLMYKEIQKLNNISKKNMLIYELGTVLNDIVMSNDYNKVYNRDKELNKIIEVLARKSKNNPLLIGEAGVGKTAIVEELTRKIMKKEVPYFLQNYTIISINVSSIIAGTKYRGEFEEKFNKIIKELEISNNTILFIDEMHTLIGAGGAEGAIDAANILKPVLARNSLKVIGATTINEYKKFIEKDKAFDRRFQKIIIEEPSKKSVINILNKIKIDYEKYHNITVTNELIYKIADLSEKYLTDRKEPDRSIDILDEACAYASINSFKNNVEIKAKEKNKLIILKQKLIRKKKFEEATKINEKILNLNKNMCKKYTTALTYEDIKYVIESKTNQKILSDLELVSVISNLNKIIIGQESAIDMLSKISVMKKYSNKPLSILFEGLPGVGKTYCAEEYANILNYNLIKLDMNEYNNEISINRILGSPKGYVGYEDENNTFESLKFYPNSIIIFDDIEKAHNKIINLINTILTTGIIKNNKNDNIDFTNSTIIITSTKNNDKNIGFTNANQEDKNDNIYKNINYKIKFNSLNKINIKTIIRNNIKNFNLRNNTNFKLTLNEIEKIVDKSNYEIMGAKKLESIIYEHLEYKYIKI